ncbi:MAG: hypothetical protein IT210_12855 [Armatimonadetes bacterium]|nr:hypothetical protein [Armatimonadota bacterium]
MFECPICQNVMEETPAMITECCGAEVSEEGESCPICGMEDPILIEGEMCFRCENCGYSE